MSASPAEAENGEGDIAKKPIVQWSNAFDDVDIEWADSSLIVCSAVCGIVDSVAFNAGSVFVSMQTGTCARAVRASFLPDRDADRVRPG